MRKGKKGKGGNGAIVGNPAMSMLALPVSSGYLRSSRVLKFRVVKFRVVKFRVLKFRAPHSKEDV